MLPSKGVTWYGGDVILTQVDEDRGIGKRSRVGNLCVAGRRSDVHIIIAGDVAYHIVSNTNYDDAIHVSCSYYFKHYICLLVAKLV